MKTFNDRPIFLADVDSEDCTITTISLVEYPAMELPMYCFEKEMVRFSMQDEMKHNIISCIVRTDYPILRLTEDGNPYYIMFNKEASEKLCQKLMRDGFQQNVSLDHNGELISGIQLQEVFIKDSEKGISPKGFEDAAEGSLFGIYHITDESLWNDCLEGRFGGVSLESYLRLQTFKNINIKNKNNHMSKIKEALKRLLMEFNNLSTDKAELYWEEDTELMVGYKVFVEDEAGNKVPAADGEYVSDENVIKVEGGVVTEIEKKEENPENTQEEVQEETKEETQEEAMEEVQETVEETIETPENTPENNEDKTAELEKRVADLEAKIAELEAKIVDIATTPAAAPVIDEFEKVTKKTSTGDKKLDKRIAIAQALKN